MRKITIVRVWAITFVAMYFVCAFACTLWMLTIRQPVIEKYSSALADENWKEWREEVQKQNDPSEKAQNSVARRPVKSESPPILVLMRDYFWISWLALIVMGSVVYGTFAFLFFGAFFSENRKTTVQLPDPTSPNEN